MASDETTPLGPPLAAPLPDARTAVAAWWPSPSARSGRIRVALAVAVVASAIAAAQVLLLPRGAQPASVVILATLACLIAASRMWPVAAYYSRLPVALALDEGLFLAGAAVFAPRDVLAVFACGALARPLARRPAPSAAAFDVATVVAAAGAGLLLVDRLAPGEAVDARRLAAASLGAAVYAAVGALASLGGAKAVREPVGRREVAAGLQVTAALFVVSAVFGLAGATAVALRPWAGLPILALFGAFRLTLVSHLQVRRDRERILGLFDAAVDVSRQTATREVVAVLSEAASSLLRCTVSVGDEPPRPGALAAPLQLGEATRWLAAQGTRHRDPFGDLDAALLGALASVGSVALANAAFFEEREREQESLAAFTASLGVGVCAFTSKGRIRFANPAAEQILGWSLEELRSADDATMRAQLSLVLAPALRSIQQRRVMRSQLATFSRRDGELFPVEFTSSPVWVGNELIGATVTFWDISERVEADEKLTFNASHDSLTGLFNRRVFLERLQRTLARSAASDASHAVLFVDVDRFKTVNDSLGHQAGDQLLATIATRLQSLIGPRDVLARFGGDEFTLLLEAVADAGAAEEIARSIIEAVREPIVLDSGQNVILGASVGIALARADSNPDDVLHHADVAMYRAKGSGWGQYEFFDEERDGHRTSALVELQVELERALDERELVTYYQPIVATDTLKVTGAEALVRWRHPRRGLLLPGEFIGLAEGTGMIRRLGAQVLEHACAQAAAWRDQTGIPLHVSVNLSARQFAEKNLVGQIAEVVHRTGITPAQLCLEITETIALQDSDRSIGVLRELKDIGIRLALDDFGTAYSSLNYLRRLPVDIVKLDRSFVQDLTVSSVGAAIVGSIVSLARTIGLSVVAEGVETEEEFERLAEMGCPSIQGNWFAAPMPASALTQCLDETSQAGGARVLRLADAPARERPRRRTRPDAPAATP